MKKIFFLAYLSIFSIVISQTYSYDKLQFDLIPDMNEYEVSALNEEIEGDIFIPPYYQNRAVRKIAKFGFSFCVNIKKVVFPHTITSIGWGAFGTTGLTEILLNNGLLYIDNFAFECTDLRYILIPSTVEYIGYTAFGGNSKDLIVEILNDESVSANWHRIWNWNSDTENTEGRTVTVVWNSTVSDFDNEAIYTHSVDTTCIVAESLRLRKEETMTSATLQTMQPGTQVQILQLGKKETIDGITANWVQVQLVDGTKGWCFGGYLVEK